MSRKRLPLFSGAIFHFSTQVIEREILVVIHLIEKP
jgi:hypothetical protein